MLEIHIPKYANAEVPAVRSFWIYIYIPDILRPWKPGHLSAGGRGIQRRLTPALGGDNTNITENTSGYTASYYEKVEMLVPPIEFEWQHSVITIGKENKSIIEYDRNSKENHLSQAGHKSKGTTSGTQSMNTDGKDLVS